MHFTSPSGHRRHATPGGFWLRFFAYLIDLSILSIPALLISYFITGALVALTMGLTGTSGGTFSSSMLTSLLMGTLIAALVGLLLQSLVSFFYFPIFESSYLQATPGKWVFKLIVTEEDGEPLTFARAFGRNVARWTMIIPFFAGLIFAVLTGKLLGLNGPAALIMATGILGTLVTAIIQYPMAGFTANKQALHDLLAHTLVVRREEMPFGESTVKAIVACIVWLVIRSLMPSNDANSANGKELFKQSNFISAKNDTSKIIIEKFTLSAGEEKTIHLSSTSPVTVGYSTSLSFNESKRCKNYGIEIKDLIGKMGVTTPIGGAIQAKPENGKVLVAFTNHEDFPIAVEVYRK